MKFSLLYTNPNPGTVSGAAWIKYSFDANYRLGKMWIWNMNQYAETDRGLRRVTVEYTSDGSTWQKLGDYEIPEAAGATGYPHNYEIDFCGVYAKAVCITANTSGGNWGDSGPYYGLSEVKFGLYDF